MGIARICGATLSIGLITACYADGTLSGMQTTEVKAPGAWSLDVRSNFYRDAEDRTYTSAALSFGLQPRWELGFRGAFASVGFSSTPAAIRTGGTDLEFYVKHAVEGIDRLTLMAGVAFPNTPAQDKPFFTYGATYGFEQQPGGSKFYVGGRGVWHSDDSLIGVSGGFEMPFANGFEFFGDITGIVHGDNTRDGNTGLPLRRAVWGIGARYNFNSTQKTGMDGSVYLMLTTGLGITTGTSLSPALGNRPALAIGFTIRGKS
jgi:hypothetical protein